MPFILRDTTSSKTNPERPVVWAKFQARARAEGHSLAWVLWELIRRYVVRGLD